jgi:hypothetical protein
MRDEKFLSFDLFFSSRVKNAQAISKTRDKISFLIQNRSKNSAKRLPLLFKEQKVSLVRSKIQKKQQTNFTEQRKHNEKIIRRRRSPLGRNSTHHFVVLIYIHRSHLK